MTQEVQRIENWQNEIEKVQRILWPDFNKEEVECTVALCHQLGLNPIARQVYAFVKTNKKTGHRKLTVNPTVDGFRVIAERSGLYEGQTQTLWCGKDGVWKDIWLPKEFPLAAKVGIYRKGFREAVWRSALFSTFAQGYSNHNGEFILSDTWKKMPDLMLAKCAESQALRTAFPNDLSGLYTHEEMSMVHEKTVECEVEKEDITKLVIAPMIVPAASVQENVKPSEAQLKRLFTIASVSRATHAQVKEYIFSIFGIETSKDLTLQQYDQLCNDLEKGVLQQWFEKRIIEPQTDAAIDALNAEMNPDPNAPIDPESFHASTGTAARVITPAPKPPEPSWAKYREDPRMVK